MSNDNQHNADQFEAHKGDVNQSNVHQSNVHQSNVDKNEVAKFDDLARKWWDLNSEFKPLHDINPLRMDYITSKVSVENKHVLDVGCGGGILSESLANSGADVTGIDIPALVADYIIQQARQ